MTASFVTEKSALKLWVNEGVAASALVERQMPPLPAALAPSTPAMSVFESVGSTAMSVTERLLTAVGTVNLVNVGVTPKKFVER